MDNISRQAEHLVNLLDTIRASAKAVYDMTAYLIDLVPDGETNPQADMYVNHAYDELLRASNLLDMGRNFLATGVYPHYTPDVEYSVGLERRSDEQKSRLDDHLRLVCLGDTGDLEPRRDAAQATIDGMLEVYKSRDILFYLLERRRLSSSERRLADGIVELSIDYVEAIAGVVRRSTQVTFR